MWQRIQSLFLGIVMICSFLGLIYPIWSSTSAGVEYILYPIHFLTKAPQGSAATGADVYFPYCVIAALMVAAGTVSIMEFRRYDNRLLQMKLGALNTIFLAGVLICEVVFCRHLIGAYAGNWKYEPGLYLAFMSLLCNWLAIRFIRRDEKIVRDSDRIR